MDARLVAARLPGLAMYGSPYASPSFPGYIPYGPAAAAVAAASEPAPFYPHMTPGENGDAWRASITQAAAAYYDPALAAHYGYGYGPMGLSDGARRKNATRETTSTLKAWLNEHRKNPYPTKGEKIMLAIITKMSLTQVSTWFANARRRLKKENKMTWSPRNRCGEDDDDDDMVDDINNSNPANNTSRSSTPTGVDVGPLSQLPSAELAGSSETKHISHSSGHTSGGETSLDEGAEHRRTLFGSDPDKHTESDDAFADGSDSGRDKAFSHIGRANNDERKLRHLSSHSARHAAHPYSSPRSSPPHVNPLPPVHPAFVHPNIPFPSPVPCHRMLHPAAALPGKFNPAAAASLLAASRGHPFPPHLMAALNEQAQLHHYQQTLQNFTLHSALSLPMSENKAGLPGSGNQSPTFSLPVLQMTSAPLSGGSNSGNTAATSPTKPKIWSIADVATSSDHSKHSVGRKSPEEFRPHSGSPTKDLAANLSAASIDESGAVRKWMDSALQHRMAAISRNNLSAAAAAAADASTQHSFQQFVSSLHASTSPHALHSHLDKSASLSQAVRCRAPDAAATHKYPNDVYDATKANSDVKQSSHGKKSEVDAVTEDRADRAQRAKLNRLHPSTSSVGSYNDDDTADVQGTTSS